MFFRVGTAGLLLLEEDVLETAEELVPIHLESIAASPSSLYSATRGDIWKAVGGGDTRPRSHVACFRAGAYGRDVEHLKFIGRSLDQTCSFRSG